MSTDELFQHALSLAKQGHTDQALQALKQYLKQSPTDVRAWWVLANVVNDVDVKRKSLARVLQLQPDHAKAKAMLDSLDATSPSWLNVQAKPSEAFKTMTATPSPVPDPVSMVDNAAFSMPIAGAAAPIASPAPSPKLPSMNELQEKRAKIQADSPLRRKQHRAVSPAVVVLGTLAALIVIALGVLVYLRFFTGPDLAESADNELVAIRYPRNWQHTQHEDFYNTVVMTTSIIPTDRVNPWPHLIDQYMLQFQAFDTRYTVTYWTHYFEWGRSLSPDRVRENVEDFSATMIFQRYNSDDLAVAVLQTIPLAATNYQYNVNDVGRAFGQWMVSGITLDTQLRKIEVSTEVTPLTIEGHRGQFVAINFTERSPLGVVHDAIYIGTVQGEEYGYLMLFSGVEQRSGEWHNTALAMTKTIKPKTE